MISLTELVFLFKKSKKKIAVFCGIFIFFILILSFQKAIIKAIFPPKPPGETVAFGTLPSFDLSGGVKQMRTIEFRLQTITGNLPSLPKRAKVFAFAQKIPSFASEQVMKDKVRSLGFNDSPSDISGSTFVFLPRDKTDERTNIKLDILSGTFLLGSTIKPEMAGERLADLANPLNKAHNFFSVMGLDFFQFPKEKAVSKMLKFEDGSLVESDALINTDFLEVDYYFTEIDGLPTTYLKKGGSPVFTIVSNDKVIYAKKEIRDIELFRFATYPLKTIASAWDELKSGKGYFNSDPGTSSIDIRDIKLGYVIDTKFDRYLQPVYLFMGDNNFVAFIPAVDDKWISRSN